MNQSSLHETIILNNGIGIKLVPLKNIHREEQIVVVIYIFGPSFPQIMYKYDDALDPIMSWMTFLHFWKILICAYH